MIFTISASVIAYRSTYLRRSSIAMLSACLIWYVTVVAGFFNAFAVDAPVMPLEYITPRSMCSVLSPIGFLFMVFMLYCPYMDNYFFLTRQSRKVLKGLVKLSSGEDCHISFSGDNHFSTSPEKSYSYKKYSGEIHSILDQLSKCGLIVMYDSGYSLRLTQEGLHYFQYRGAWLRAYVLDKLFDALALIVSAVALGMSIAALIK